MVAATTSHSEDPPTSSNQRSKGHDDEDDALEKASPSDGRNNSRVPTSRRQVPRDTAKSAHRVASRKENEEDRLKRRAERHSSTRQIKKEGSATARAKALQKKFDLQESWTNAVPQSEDKNEGECHDEPSNEKHDEPSPNEKYDDDEEGETKGHEGGEVEDALLAPTLRAQRNVGARPRRPGAVRVMGMGEDGNGNPVPTNSNNNPNSATGNNNDDAQGSGPTQDENPEGEETLAHGVTVSNDALAQEYRDQVLRDVPYATCTVAEKRVPIRKRYGPVLLVAVIVLLIAVLGAVVGVLFAQGRGSTDGGASIPASPPGGPASGGNPPPTAIGVLEPTMSPTTSEDYYRTYSKMYELLHDTTKLEDPTTVYAKTFERLVYDRTVPSTGRDLVTRIFLTAFFELTQGDQWTNNTNWNTSASMCTWYGVACRNFEDTTREKLEELVLAGNNLQGSLLPEISTVGWLKFDLSNNQLTGSVPEYFDYFVNRDYLLIDLSGNQLTGTVPMCGGGVDGDVKVDCDRVECNCCTPSCD